MHSTAFRTRSLQDPRLMRILKAALDAAEPAALVRRALRAASLQAYSRCFLLGLGKAAERMTHGAAQAIPDYESALIVTKKRVLKPLARCHVLEAGHPVPDERSVVAGKAVLDFVRPLGSQDLLICLISGGGSALATAPVNGVSLADMRELTSAALASGAGIDEINTVRRCLDRVKGGGLAAATHARVYGLILSDVISDDVAAIASGPTVPGSADRVQAAEFLTKLLPHRSGELIRLLDSAAPGTAGAGQDRITNVIVGGVALAAHGALQQATKEGFFAELVDAPFQGEAQAVGRLLAQALATSVHTRPRPAATLAFGESTVNLGEHHGRGGRNQELALAAVDTLQSAGDCMLIALATDGEDGPTDAAGAVVTGTTATRAGNLGLTASDCLDRHDSYTYFEALGDLLRPGSTGTNVNDLVLLVAL